MLKKSIILFLSLLFILTACGNKSESYLDIRQDVIEDKIRGGWLGQLLGNLNGLPHEMRYIDEPGSVESYIPALPEGARSDDDTDIEWIYISAMQENDRIMLTPGQISDLWRKHINERIWCSNLYARNLMNLGIKPPLTGMIALNPWAIFNISGQFICESFGLIAPAMPQTAAKIGLNYTHVTIDGEPAQTTQLFTTMIATAYIENDINKIIRAGLAAIDKESQIYTIVNDVYSWWQQYPSEWRKCRAVIKEKYSLYNGEMRDKNGYELNTASTIASLLYGNGDFAETLRHAFNFGWDADNNAATCGTIVGVIKGRKWMDEQGWIVKDVYKNVTRDAMPLDETITSFGDRLIELARKVIVQQGGAEFTVNGEMIYRIHTSLPANIEPLPKPLDRTEELYNLLSPDIQKDIKGSRTDKARAAYLAIALDEAEKIRSADPQLWTEALQELEKYPQVIKNIFNSPGPNGEKLIKLAEKAGLRPVKQ